MSRPSKILIAALVLGGALVLAGCSINRLAVRVVAGVMTGGGGAGAFGRDDDPELVAQALPFALKLYESLLDADPENTELLLATGSAYTMYAYAFVQAPADLLPDSEVELQAAQITRARRLFLRGREYVFRALELRHPGKFRAYVGGEAAVGDDLLAQLDFLGPKDIDYIYWAAASWMAAVSASQFDMGLIVSVPKAVALIRKVLSLDETYGAGGAHDLMVSYYGAGIDPDPDWKTRAREHHQRAVELSGGTKAGMYVSYAMAVTISDQDVQAFTSLLETALAVDLSASPDTLLENTIAQRKARWLLDHVDRYFLLDEGVLDEGEVGEDVE